LDEAKKADGPEIINVTLIIPIVLIVAFASLFLFMKSKKSTPAA
jgi:flagellar basal body-associated protein FliL